MSSNFKMPTTSIKGSISNIPKFEDPIDMRGFGDVQDVPVPIVPDPAQAIRQSAPAIETQQVTPEDTIPALLENIQRGPSQEPTEEYLKSEYSKPRGVKQALKEMAIGMIPFYGPAYAASKEEERGYAKNESAYRQQIENARYEREAELIKPLLESKIKHQAMMDNMAHDVVFMKSIYPNMSESMIEGFIQKTVGMNPHKFENIRIKLRGVDSPIPAIQNEIGEIRYMQPNGRAALGTVDSDPMIEQVLPMVSAYEMRPPATQTPSAYNLQMVEVKDNTAPGGHRAVYADPRNPGTVYDAATGALWEPPDGVIERWDEPSQPRQDRFTPITTDTGIYAFDPRVGKVTGSALTDVEGEKLLKTPAAARERMVSLADQIADVEQLRHLANRNRGAIGVIRGRVADIGRWIGTQSSEVNDLFRIADNLADKLLRARSGAQINEREYARLRSLIPDPRYSESKFFSDLDSFEQELLTLSQARTKEYSKATGTGVPVEQKNKTTGQYRHSFDGGKTWKKGRLPGR